MLHPSVSVPQLHPLARACTHLRLWSKPDPAAGAQTAEILLIFAWIVYAIALAVLLPDVSSRTGAATFWLLVGVPDAFLRLWQIRATFLLIPVCVLCPGIAALVLCW